MVSEGVIQDRKLSNTKECQSLAQVLDHLMTLSFYDGNNTHSKLINVPNNYCVPNVKYTTLGHPILSKATDNLELITAIDLATDDIQINQSPEDGRRYRESLKSVRYNPTGSWYDN